MKKFIIGLLIVILVAAGSAAGLGYAYIKSDDYTSKSLGDNYTLNGVDCSNMTFEEAAKALTNKWNHQAFTVKDQNGKKLGTYTSLGCTYNLEGQLDSLKKNNFVMAAINHYLHTKVEVDLKHTVKSCSNSFKKEVMASEFLEQGEDVVPGHDAYVDVSNPEFPIVKEAYGTDVDKSAFFDAVVKKICAGKSSLVYNEEEYYRQPKVLSDDPELAKYQTFCKEHLGQKIEYKMGKSTFTLSPEDLAGFYATDGSGDINGKGIETFVKGMAEKYDNVGIKRTIKTFEGQTVTVKGGTYGWTIDQAAEVKKLKEDLKSGKDVSRTPEYSNTGFTEYQDGIGDTYIDVDLGKQRVTLYVNGKNKFRCSVVSGDKSKGKATPEGTWYLKNKLTDVTMHGTNADGTKYAVPAKYWMGVTPNGIGLHDSNWRTEFGGDIWKTNGSHGCINMPKDKIKGLFDQVKVNMPVLMHY